MEPQTAVLPADRDMFFSENQAALFPWLCLTASESLLFPRVAGTVDGKLLVHGAPQHDPLSPRPQCSCSVGQEALGGLELATRPCSAWRQCLPRQGRRFRGGGLHGSRSQAAAEPRELLPAAPCCGGEPAAPLTRVWADLSVASTSAEGRLLRLSSSLSQQSPLPALL